MIPMPRLPKLLNTASIHHLPALFSLSMMIYQPSSRIKDSRCSLTSPSSWRRGGSSSHRASISPACVDWGFAASELSREQGGGRVS